jgi:ubiquinone/menaquinone biosynthesis C-methylase UbiE
MSHGKFDPKEAHKLTDPGRLEFESPELVWETLNPNNPGIVVDIGAGNGFYSIPFCEKMNEGLVYACDSSEEMLDKLRERIPQSFTQRIIPVISGDKSIPLEDGIADLVIMANLHHELDDPKGMIRESLRLLKSGGSLVIIDWNTEESPMGPPLHIRVPDHVIAGQFKEAGLVNTLQYQVLKYHSFTVGEKP